MAAISFHGATPIPYHRKINKFRFSCRSQNKRETPQLLKLAVSGVTEILRIFSPDKDPRLDNVTFTQKDQPLVCGLEDVVLILRSDYENAYFITGNFTPEIYAEDCSFEDPTIQFRGKDLYARNLKLLVPFFERASLDLQQMEKVATSETIYVLATWKLRTYLKLPWKPLISIEGSTVYNLNDDFKIVRHAESWNISALEAVGQIFTPSFGRNGE
ncbi:hypothetical protein ACHQM5_014790 [Ranunculus cassubicifolius]